MSPSDQNRLPLPPAGAPGDCVFVLTDGAARGNPGPAAYGVLFSNAQGDELARLSKTIGNATNNVAEYQALIAALEFAKGKGWQALCVRTDSELMARQVRREYKVKNAGIKPLHAKALDLIAALDYFRIEEVPRSQTRAADKLANQALDGI